MQLFSYQRNFFSITQLIGPNNIFVAYQQSWRFCFNGFEILITVSIYIKICGRVHSNFWVSHNFKGRLDKLFPTQSRHFTVILRKTCNITGFKGFYSQFSTFTGRSCFFLWNYRILTLMFECRNLTCYWMYTYRSHVSISKFPWISLSYFLTTLVR